ncbi:Phosphoribosyltransferase C-terminal [Arabidopsis suecica]|uniref:Phosphoribosyltransferase C-terminal n=1 Tax=Arabidopsis suecica TaxID=45249 RepID=A0A8T2B8P2_ARASU|nr:Phosphoribosyltransferase C-terminal [Arabidopsis suecica]
MMISFLPLIIFLIGLISYFWSSELLPHIDMTLSQETSTSEFDLDKETDTIPSSRPSDIVSLKYDRLRTIAAATQTTLGYVSCFVERVSLLFSWQDRRATGLFLFFCFITSVVLVPLWFMSRMSSGNDYSRFLSAQNVAAPIRSQARLSRNRNPSSPASQNQQAVGSTPPPFNPNTPNPSNPNSPNPSHSATQPALNSLTLDELLDSPGRASLKRLDPRRPPGTLWFDDDPAVAGTVRSIFERDFKEPHANWTQTPEPVVNRWYETFAQVYNWDRSINKRVRMEFETKLKDRMCDQISRWKGKWKRKGDEAKPKWIDPEVWAGLVWYWLDPQSEIRSINARNARYHDPDGLGIHKHCSGQTSFKARARKRCERTGDTTPDFLVLLDETHRKPDGTFINRKSEELYKEVTSRIEEEESQLCSGESSASGGLSVAAKNKIYAEVAPRKKGRIYGVGSQQNEASSVHVGPLPTHNDREVLLEKLAAAEARLQLQAEKINSFDAYWEYLAEKDPVFAGMYRGPSEPANADTTRTAEGDQTGTNQTGTNQTGTDQTATGTRPGSSTSQAF